MQNKWPRPLPITVAYSTHNAKRKVNVLCHSKCIVLKRHNQSFFLRFRRYFHSKPRIICFDLIWFLDLWLFWIKKNTSFEFKHRSISEPRIFKTQIQTRCCSLHANLLKWLILHWIKMFCFDTAQRCFDVCLSVSIDGGCLICVLLKLRCANTQSIYLTHSST